jgi:aminopeptidase N
MNPSRPTPRRRGLFRAAFVAAGIALLSGTAVTGRSPGDRGYDVLTYALDLSLSPESSTVAGSVEITLVANAPIAAVRLDADSASLTIDSVLSGDRRLRFTRTGNVLEVPIPGGTRVSETVSLTVFYIARSSFDGRYDDGGIYFSRTETGYTIGTISQPNFARRWWPCNDRPSDKALVSLRCAAPMGMTVVSNGRMVSRERRDGRDVFTWATRHPIATYLVFLGATDYLVSRDTHELPDGQAVELAWYVFPGDSAKAAEDFRNTKAILDYFSSTFLPYPFADEQFAVAEVDGRLTMENQTVVAIERAMVTGDRRNENTFVHETAHQWWGDYLTPVDWHHTWLNEGFATYAEALYIESRKGPESYRQYMDLLMDQPAGFYAGSVIGRDEDAFWDSFGPAVYFKGALTLHMLRRMMGDGPFFRAMRAYLRDTRLAYGNASTDDFRSACEAEHGADLDWFFRQWVYAARDSADRPSLAYRWRQQPPDSGNALRVSVSQIDAPEPAWRLPFRIRVHGGGVTEEFAVVDSLPRQEFTLPASAPADSVLIDPERDVFMTVRKEAAP